ncbi:hypothetical protein KJ611_03600 [Patescibacteria group bacterium]|nr:hypothetical protein [Patescibacteria group bacterium]MBU1705247.1 hypothetical protein [Patescibacteria group bacterium]
MYYYIYDEFIQDKRYEKELIRIENRLADLGITGKISRLALFRDPTEMIADEVSRGVSTVVAVGNDQTVRKIIDVVADQNVIFGLIPLGTPNNLAKLLGLPEGVPACDILSARSIETIDLGSVNGRRFISGLSVPNFSAEITYDGKFKIEPARPGTLEIRNLAGAEISRETLADPRDGLFETTIRVGLKKGWNFFKKQKYGESLLTSRRLAIRSREPISLIADGEEMIDKRFDIRMNPQPLQVITSRRRMF